ncbi:MULTISPECIES: HNH endonuclease signature motif containing protein [Pantoea]|uniref:HNH endonuclease signature motif containing protein n=1 Tax=Pantoea TaxID=53335 RepID=UPI00157652BA|nr:MULTISPECIES: HNH endonuclease signature motif containing protein [Pantoea]MDI3413716.1 HNH endonuclease signature motif containing protein [Pantoea sp. V106_11]NQE77075.1 hypothetical protein [Pantoea ananatis]NQE85422.1 hypothetical protein [Pantoea ananatis]
MEVWKKTQYKNYEVSNTGVVRNITKKNPLDPKPGTNGYKKVCIAMGKGQNGVTKEVHRIVAEIFIPNSKPGLVVDHIDGDKLNNHADNLQWITQKQNMQKATRKSNNEPRLTQNQIDEIIVSRKDGKSFNKITKEMNEKYSRTSHRQTYTRAYNKAKK